MKKINTVISSFLIVLFSLMVFQQAHASSTDDRMSDEILMYINQYRVQHRLQPLTMNRSLSQEAAIHSREMATHALPFGHDGFQRRMNHLHTHLPQSTSGAENVAYNYKTAKIVADGWINSPGHRQNIMGHYNLTGIGIARDSQGKLYYTQLFLRNDNHPIVASRSVHTHSVYIETQARRHGHRVS